MDKIVKIYREWLKILKSIQISQLDRRELEFEIESYAFRLINGSTRPPHIKS